MGWLFNALDPMSVMALAANMNGYTAATFNARSLAHIDTLPAADRATLRQGLAAKEAGDIQDVQKVSVGLMTNQIARCLVVSGLRSLGLRRLAAEYHRDKPMMNDFVKALTEAARRENNPPAKSNGQASAVYPGSASDEEDTGPSVEFIHRSPTGRAALSPARCAHTVDRPSTPSTNASRKWNTNA